LHAPRPRGRARASERANPNYPRARNARAPRNPPGPLPLRPCIRHIPSLHFRPHTLPVPLCALALAAPSRAYQALHLSLGTALLALRRTTECREEDRPQGVLLLSPFVCSSFCCGAQADLCRRAAIGPGGHLLKGPPSRKCRASVPRCAGRRRVRGRETFVSGGC
jgi:hypothetical protein